MMIAAALFVVGALAAGEGGPASPRVEDATKPPSATTAPDPQAPLDDAALGRKRVQRWRPGRKLPYADVKKLEREELLALYTRVSMDLELDGFEGADCKRVEAVTRLSGVCAAWMVPRSKPLLTKRDAATVEKVERALASAAVHARYGTTERLQQAKAAELGRIRRGEHARGSALVRQALDPDGAGQ